SLIPQVRQWQLTWLASAPSTRPPSRIPPARFFPAIRLITCICQQKSQQNFSGQSHSTTQRPLLDWTTASPSHRLTRWTSHKPTPTAQLIFTLARNHPELARTGSQQFPAKDFSSCCVSTDRRRRSSIRRG